MTKYSYFQLDKVNTLIDENKELKSTIAQLIEQNRKNNDDCDFCNECVECCPEKALSIVNNQIHFQTDKCTHCELWDDVCPVGAIWIETLDYEELSE